jgi:hypothetical protein
VLQKVESIQIDRRPVQEAARGSEIGLKVEKPVRVDDRLWLIQHG